MENLGRGLGRGLENLERWRRIAVRVKLLIREPKSGREIVTNALVNSGFETLTIKILIPKNLANELGLWPVPADASVVSLESSGGEVGLYLIKNGVMVKLYGEDMDFVMCDVLVSTIEREVLISDKLASALKIVLEDPGEGLRRLRTDPPDRLRRSEELQEW